MPQQHHVLRRRREQSEPRYTGNVAAATDTGGHRTPALFRIGAPPQHRCLDFQGSKYETQR
jgi:hypothetical protein